MEVIGETLDDAAGEAFDKSAKLLGLPYPGGPLIDKYAREGDASRFTFPEPQIPGLNFSFSGLKTAILYFLQDRTAEDAGFIAANLPDICASVQGRIVSILLNKLKKAARQTGVTDLCIAGGVSANSGLRQAFREMGEREGWNTFIPPFEYCTDNAAMIAITGHYKYLAGDFASLSISATAHAYPVFQVKPIHNQPDQCAMKVCTDACILGAWFADKAPSYARVLDIGSGTGLLMLMLAQKHKGEITGIEIDLDAFRQLKDNIGQSPWPQLLRVFPGDVRSWSFPG